MDEQAPNSETVEIPIREWLEDRRHIGMKLGLEATMTMLSRLDMPHMHFPCVHIAGSNGKGTTAAHLANSLTLSGNMVGLFSSPHLCHVEERIRIDGKLIDPKQLDRALHAIRTLAAEAPAIELSYFETLFLASMIIFRATGVDRAVIETGLGGRLDATRTCIADLTILTDISREHRSILGDTLKKIAREKAAIARPGSKMLARWPYDKGVRKEIEKACNNSKGYWFRGDRMELYSFEDSNEAVRGLSDGDGILIPLGFFDGHMPMLYDNAMLAQYAALLLGENPPLASTVVECTTWPGRMQEFDGPHDIGFLLDCAHNPSGLTRLTEELIVRRGREEDAGRYFCPDAIVFGATQQDDIDAFLHPLVELMVAMDDPMLVLTEPTSGRTPPISADNLLECVRQHHPGARVQVRPNVRVALDVAMEEARAGASNSVLDGVTGTVWAFGSLYLIGDLLQLLGKDSFEDLQSLTSSPFLDE